MPNRLTKVHIVIEGEYSDQKIVAVWSTRERAQQQLDMSSNRFRIESLELDALADRITQGLSEWAVRMRRNGDLAYAINYGICDDNYFPPRAHVYVHQWHGDQQYIHCRCWARSEEHAIKITNDIRTRVIANNNWTHKYEWKAQEEENNA